MAPETEARDALIGLLKTEFADEEFPVRDDKLHGSLGADGTVLAVYPNRTISDPGNRYVNRIEVVVQFYGKYDLEVDPNQFVHPTRIEDYAERFRVAIRTTKPDPDTSSVWYFTLERIEYPDDPTGNKTRFEAFLTARGNNTALLETSG